MVAGGDTPSDSQSNAGRAGALGNFVARVLGETEDVWSEELPRQAGLQEGPVLP
jgi:predicted metalloprotease